MQSFLYSSGKKSVYCVLHYSHARVTNPTCNIGDSITITCILLIILLIIVWWWACVYVLNCVSSFRVYYVRTYKFKIHYFNSLVSFLAQSFSIKHTWPHPNWACSSKCSALMNETLSNSMSVFKGCRFWSTLTRCCIHKSPFLYNFDLRELKKNNSASRHQGHVFNEKCLLNKQFFCFFSSSISQRVFISNDSVIMLHNR